MFRWYIESVKRQLRGVERSAGEAEFLLAIDDEDGGEKEKIVGFAVWSWSVKVRYCHSKSSR